MILSDLLTPQWPLGLEAGLGVGLNAKKIWNITRFCTSHVAQIPTQLPAVRVCCGSQQAQRKITNETVFNQRAKILRRITGVLKTTTDKESKHRAIYSGNKQK